MRKDELSPELEQAVEGKAAGSVTDPVPARGGLHVCVIEDFKEPSLPSFGEVSGQILREERRRLRNERTPAFMEDLEKLSYIRADPPPGAEGFKLYRGSVAEDLPELPEGQSESAQPGEELDPETAAAIRETEDAFKEVTVEVPVGPAPEEKDKGGEGTAEESQKEPPEEAPPPR
jgi:hypothetical protein